ncbi:hypothetical protein DXU07_46435 [Bradyrhizobium elkanii]
MRSSKGRSDARRESADAEGSRSFETAARPWRERAADRRHGRHQPVDSSVERAGEMAARSQRDLRRSKAAAEALLQRVPSS